MKNLKLFLLAMIILSSYTLTAQNVSITTDGSAPDSSAMLEVKSTDKGMLIPRVALTETTDETTISSPAVSLMIYNTATATDVTPGFYYWNDTAWTPVSETADGSETKVTAGTNVTVTGVGTTLSPYVVNASGATTYSVGDFAHGGIVFWVDETGQHGSICAKADQHNGDRIRWYAGDYGDTQAKGNGVWSGAANTSIIIAAQVAIGDDGGTYAARVCNEEQITEAGITYGDWYLPSRSELAEMYNQKSHIDATAIAYGGHAFHPGGGPDDYYWTSTEHNDKRAWYRGMGNGYESESNQKYHHMLIRCIRRF
ncbi:MAG: DUF1566 domain-containing protein [Gammaproteobacteria bacterium]|nr:DUF1566 domain-containing protein [Gammaproteobacteria bacterium]